MSEYLLVYTACPECNNRGMHSGAMDGPTSCLGPGRKSRRVAVADLIEYGVEALAPVKDEESVDEP